MASGQKGRSDVWHPRWMKDCGMDHPYNCLGTEYSRGSQLMGEGEGGGEGGEEEKGGEKEEGE